MHFAFPPRKSSNPPPYARRNNAAASYLQNGRLRLLALVALAALTLIWIIRSFGTGQITQESVPYGTPGAVIVTMFDPKVEKDIQKAVMANREAYAAEHGELCVDSQLDRKLRQPRLCDLLSQSNRLRCQDLTNIMGDHPLAQTRHDSMATHPSILLPGTISLDHGAKTVARVSHHGF